MIRTKKYIIYSAVFTLLMLSGCTFNKNANPSSSETTDLTPSSPSPSNNATDQLLVVDLKWESTGDKFDVYFSKKNPPTILYSKDITAKKLLLTGLDYSTRYYWKVVAKTNSGTESQGSVWSFTTTSQTSPSLNGYALISHGLTTSSPSNVNVLFQVVDLNGKGITTLTSDDFEVYEDGLPISASESQMTVKKKNQLPYKIKTVLMLDNSTSLKDSIDAVRSAAYSLVRNLLDNQQVTIYSFSESQYLLQGFTADSIALISSLASYQLGYPTTDLYGAVIKGASLWEDSLSSDSVSQGFMIIFTDGHDTQGSHTLADALNSIDKKIVYAIGLGSDIDTEVLDRIGTAGFYNINNTQELKQQFLYIQNDILTYANSFYLLSYQSPKRGDESHTLYIRIKNNPYTGAGATLVEKFNSEGFTSN